jgi:hypothetical protein
MTEEDIEFTSHALQRAQQYNLPDRDTLRLMFLQGEEERNDKTRLRKNEAKYGVRSHFTGNRYCLLPNSKTNGVKFTYLIKPTKRVVITVYPKKKGQVRTQD